jgi:hypothetical protein
MSLLGCLEKAIMKLFAEPITSYAGALLNGGGVSGFFSDAYKPKGVTSALKTPGIASTALAFSDGRFRGYSAGTQYIFLPLTSS